jgi:hypothetical protein
MRLPFILNLETKALGQPYNRCQSCVEIDKQVERYRELLRSLTQQMEAERINELIARLYADRVRLHRNPEK